MKVIIRIRKHNKDLTNPTVLKTKELKKVINAFNGTDRFNEYRSSTGPINSLLVTHVKTKYVNEADIRFNIETVNKETTENEISKTTNAIADILSTIFTTFPNSSDYIDINVMPDIITDEMRKYGEYHIKFDVDKELFHNYTESDDHLKMIDSILLLTQLKAIYHGETKAHQFAYCTDESGVKREYTIKLNDKDNKFVLIISSCGGAGVLVAGILTALCNKK